MAWRNHPRGEDFQPNLDGSSFRQRRREEPPSVRSSAPRGRGGPSNRHYNRNRYYQQAIRREPSPERRYDERSRYPPVPTGPRNRPAPFIADRGRPTQSLNDPNSSRYIPTGPNSARRPSPPPRRSSPPRYRSPSPRLVPSPRLDERRSEASSPRQPFPATQAPAPKNSFALFKEESVSPEKPQTQPPRVHSPPVYRNPSSSGPAPLSPPHSQAGPSRTPMSSTPFSPSQLDNFPMAAPGEELSDDELALRPISRPGTSLPRPSLSAVAGSPEIPIGPRSMQKQPATVAAARQVQNGVRRSGSSDMEISSDTPQPSSTVPKQPRRESQVPAVKEEVPSPINNRSIQTLAEDIKPSLPERSPTPPPIQRRHLPVNYPLHIRTGDVGSLAPDAEVDNLLLRAQIYKFLELFFDRFDASRGAMFDFYAPHAVFSYSINGKLANPDEEDPENGFISQMIKDERNLLQTSAELSVQVQSIINKFRHFPATEHDFKAKRGKFVFDAWTVPVLLNMRAADVASPIVCTVQGEFTEMTSTRADGMRKVQRSFARSFVMLPVESSKRTTQAIEFSILSDQLHIRNYMDRPTSLVPAPVSSPLTTIEQEIASVIPPPSSTSQLQMPQATQLPTNNRPTASRTTSTPAAASQTAFQTVVNNMAAARASASPVIPATRPSAPDPYPIPDKEDQMVAAQLTIAPSRGQDAARGLPATASVPNVANVAGASSLAVLSRAQQPAMTTMIRRPSTDPSRAPSPALPAPRSTRSEVTPTASTSARVHSAAASTQQQPVASTSKHTLELPPADLERSRKKRTLSDASIMTVDSATSEPGKKASKGKSKEVSVPAQLETGQAPKKKKPKKSAVGDDGLTKDQRKKRNKQQATKIVKQVAPQQGRTGSESAAAEIATLDISNDAYEMDIDVSDAQTVNDPSDVNRLSVLEERLRKLEAEKRRVEECLDLEDDIRKGLGGDLTLEQRQERQALLKKSIALATKIEEAEAALQAGKARAHPSAGPSTQKTASVQHKTAQPSMPDRADSSSRPKGKGVLQQKPSASKPAPPTASSSKVLRIDRSDEENVPSPGATPKLPSQKKTQILSIKDSASYDIGSITGPRNKLRHIFSASRTNDYLISTMKGDVLRFDSNSRSVSSIFDSGVTRRDSPTSCYDESSSAVLFGYVDKQTAQGKSLDQVGVVALNGLDTLAGKFSLAPSPHSAPKPDQSCGIRAMLTIPRVGSKQKDLPLITGGYIDRSLYLWNLRGEGLNIACRGTPIKIETCHSSAISSLAHSAPHKMLVSGGMDKKIITYAAALTGKSISPPKMNNPLKPTYLLTGPINALRFNPVQHYMLLAELMLRQEQIVVFDVRKGSNSRPDMKFGFQSENTLSSFVNGTFSPDGKMYALGDENGLKVWDLRKPKAPAIEEKRNSSGILQVCWSEPNTIVLLEKKHISVLNVN